MHRHRVDATRSELVLLVFHQRDERTHDDRQTRQHQRRQLVDQRFAATGGHDNQCITSAEGGPNRLPLAVLKIAVAKARDENLASLGPR